MSSSWGQATLSRLHGPVLILWLVSTAGWLLFVVDNYIIHTPYALGKDCIACYNYVYYLYDFAYHYAYPGAFAAVFFVISLACLVLLWTPAHGLGTALSRTVLIAGPALVFLFEVGVYFWLNRDWNVHATDFLEGTPLTNQTVFWLSGAVVLAGIAVEYIRRR